jgi:hypothetical protein
MPDLLKRFEVLSEALGEAMNMLMINDGIIKVTATVHKECAKLT